MVNLEETFGSYILVEGFVCLSNLIFGPFMITFILGGIRNLQGDEGQAAAMYMAIFGSVLAVISFVRIVVLFTLGQDLANEWRIFKTTLTKKCIEKGEGLSAKDQIMIRVINQNFGIIRPMDCFDLRASTALSAGGIMVTYLAFLLQFKTF